jgi:hypothetical protein
MKPLPLLPTLTCFLFAVSRMWSAPNLVPELESLLRNKKLAEVAEEAIRTAGVKINQSGHRLPPPSLSDEVAANAKQLRRLELEAAPIAERILHPAQRKQAIQIAETIARIAAVGQANTFVFKVKTLASHVMTRFQRIGHEVTDEEQKKFSDLLVSSACFSLESYTKTNKLPSADDVNKHLLSSLPGLFIEPPPQVHIRECADKLQPLIVELANDPDSRNAKACLRLYCALH